MRALAYVVNIDDIKPIAGADNIVLATVRGWKVVVKKDEFKIGDMAVYFEIDSKVNAEDERFAFMARKGYKVKTMKFNRFGVFSQGLLMPLSEFPEIENPKIDMDVTNLLNVVYSKVEDNDRKGVDNDAARFARAKAKYKKLFKNPIVKKLMKYKTSRNILLFLFGRAKNKEDKGFPTKFPYISKTDETRVENMPWILESEEEWVQTLKIDGTSCTYILERGKFGKNKFYVYSRNVRQKEGSDEHSFHGENVYWQIANKFNIRKVLEHYLDKNPNWKYVCLQGEGAGVGEGGSKIQGDPHKFGELRFFGFNFIDSENGRWGSIEAKEEMKNWGIEWVPIIKTLHLNSFMSMESFKLSADGPCEAPGASGLREGYVYRSLDGKQSFKNISREYLLKNE